MSGGYPRIQDRLLALELADLGAVLVDGEPIGRESGYGFTVRRVDGEVDGDVAGSVGAAVDVYEPKATSARRENKQADESGEPFRVQRTALGLWHDRSERSLSPEQRRTAHASDFSASHATYRLLG